MRNLLVAATAAALLAAGMAPASARDDHDHGHPHGRHAGPPPRRVADMRRFREGQTWHGHRLAYRGGRWGYYAPRNGAQVFIHIAI